MAAAPRGYPPRIPGIKIPSAPGGILKSFPIIRIMTPEELLNCPVSRLETTARGKRAGIMVRRHKSMPWVMPWKASLELKIKSSMAQADAVAYTAFFFCFITFTSKESMHSR